MLSMINLSIEVLARGLWLVGQFKKRKALKWSLLPLLLRRKHVKEAIHVIINSCLKRGILF